MKEMKKWNIVLFSLLLIFACAGCSKDHVEPLPNDWTAADLIGTWTSYWVKGWDLYPETDEKGTTDEAFTDLKITFSVNSKGVESYQSNGAWTDTDFTWTYKDNVFTSTLFDSKYTIGVVNLTETTLELSISTDTETVENYYVVSFNRDK